MFQQPLRMLLERAALASLHVRRRRHGVAKLHDQRIVLAQPGFQPPDSLLYRHASIVYHADVELLVNSFFEKRERELPGLARLVEKLFASAGLEYCVAGGLAVYLYVEDAEPDAGRLTKDIDIVVRRSDLDGIARAAETFGLFYSCLDGDHMLRQVGAPSARRAVDMLFEPAVETHRVINGIRVVPLTQLVEMKLTVFRIKDQMHLKDMDEVGLISDAIERALSPLHRERLAEVRARD